MSMPIAIAIASQPSQPVPPPQDIYAEPKLLKKKRKKECASGPQDLICQSSKSLSTTEIISMIVPVKIPDLEKNVASKISGRHIAFHRSAQNVIEQDPRNKLKNTPKRSKPRKQSSAVTRRARYVELESLIKHEELSYKYEMFVPLHELWLGYMQELLGVDLDTSHQASDEASNTRVNPAGIATLPPAAAMQAKLLKADYHGALFAGLANPFLLISNKLVNFF